MNVFKVVRIENGKLISAMHPYDVHVPDHTKHICVEYKENDIVTPTYGKLFAFETEYYANRFIHDHIPTINCAIYEAESPDIFKNCVRILSDSCYISEEVLKSFWKYCDEHDYNTENNYSYAFMVVPKGSVLCSSLKLVRKVQEYNKP